MEGIDTNVLIRYLVMDEPKQAKLATKFIEKHCTEKNLGFINLTVLLELVWVFESFYKYSRDEIGMALEKIFRTKQFRIEQTRLAWQALEVYRKGLDFSDAVIGAINKENHCETTFTFDKKASKLEQFTLLK